ncbi:34212_t:CDS:1, partial [Gigaspora margarita]
LQSQILPNLGSADCTIYGNQKTLKILVNPIQKCRISAFSAFSAYKVYTIHKQKV